MTRIFHLFILTLVLGLNTFTIYSMDVDHWETIVDAGNTWRYYICDTVAPPADWRADNFDDSNWLNGKGGFGYGDQDDSTIIDPCWSVLMRINFSIADTSQIEKILFQIDFDDSFVAWINGVEIGRFGISGDEPAWNTPLLLNNEAHLYRDEDPWSVIHTPGLFRQYLKNGNNILCIQVNNKDKTSSDMSAMAWLFAGMENPTVTYQPLPQWFKAPETEWNSHLPVFVINTNHQPIPNEPKITARLEIVNHGSGLVNNPFDDQKEYNGIIGIELRGSSSQMFPKKSYGFETWSSYETEIAVSVAGLPAESDWVLYAPYTDKTLIRNALAYSLFNSFRHYSPRTKFIELYINGEYKGLYLLTEKIKRDVNRVNIHKMSANDLYDLDVTGGYLLKLDKSTGSGTTSGFFSDFLPFSGTQQPYFMFAYPKGDEIQPEQAEYIKQQVHAFETALSSDHFNDPYTGYRAYINVASFVDYFILNELSKNIDGYRLSTYLYKDRDDIDNRFHAGPVWDYDLAFGNANYAEAQYTFGWQYTIDGEENPIPFWWARLMTDDYFKGCLRCRWEELRSGTLHSDSLNHRIDKLVEQIGDAAHRNFNTFQIIGSYIWPNSYNGDTYGDEIDHLKSWLYDRTTFLDENLPGTCLSTKFENSPLKSFAATIYPNPSRGAIHIEIQNPGTPVSIQVINVNGQLVYTCTETGSSGHLTVQLPGGFYQVVIGSGTDLMVLKAIVL